MGIYDRDYFRESSNNRNSNIRRVRKPVSIVFLLIVVNVLLFLLNAFLFPETDRLTEVLCMNGSTLASPSQWYRLLTYGFVHSPKVLMHIVGNMIALGFFGRAIERKYGSREFLFFYLTAVLCGGLLWGILNYNTQDPTSMLGASGAITAVLILFAINFPKVTILLNFFIPVPAWLLGIGYIIYDLYGASSGTSNVAHEVHLAGAGFAVLYYLAKFRLERFYAWFWPGKFFKKIGQMRQNRKLKIRRDNAAASLNSSSNQTSDPDEEELDRILRKLNSSGWASLTQKEHDTLFAASEKKRSKK